MGCGSSSSHRGSRGKGESEKDSGEIEDPMIQREEKGKQDEVENEQISVNFLPCVTYRNAVMNPGEISVTEL